MPKPKGSADMRSATDLSRGRGERALEGHKTISSSLLLLFSAPPSQDEEDGQTEKNRYNSNQS